MTHGDLPCVNTGQLSAGTCIECRGKYMTYTVGDVVTHQNGQKMTVESIDNFFVNVVWFDPFDNCYRWSFKPDVLEAVAQPFGSGQH